MKSGVPRCLGVDHWCGQLTSYQSAITGVGVAQAENRFISFLGLRMGTIPVRIVIFKFLLPVNHRRYHNPESQLPRCLAVPSDPLAAAFNRFGYYLATVFRDRKVVEST